MKTRALVLCHEESVNLVFGLMMNNGKNFASGQSGLLKFLGLETMVEKAFFTNGMNLGNCADRFIKT